MDKGSQGWNLKACNLLLGVEHKRRRVCRLRHNYITPFTHCHQLSLAPLQGCRVLVVLPLAIFLEIP
jgi:hypothetical protein